MQKTTAPGNDGNDYVDRDLTAGTPGTTIVAADKNAYQTEFIDNLISKSGQTPSGSDLEQIFKAIRKTAIEDSKNLGEIFYLQDHIDPTAYQDGQAADPDNLAQDIYFPAKCLDSIDGHEDISETNWPNLVPWLRDKKATHREGTAGESTQFSVTDWAIASNVATITLANATAEQAMLDDLLDDQAVNGGYTDWRPVELPNAIGDISAGVYAITSIDTVNREITFDFTASDASGSGSFVVEFPLHKVPGDTTVARLFEASARTLVSPNDPDDDYVSGLRRRDQGQQIEGSVRANNGTSYFRMFRDAAGAIDYTGGTSTFVPTLSNDTSQQTGIQFNSANSTAQGGSRQDGDYFNPRALSAHIYVWGKRYNA